MMLIITTTHGRPNALAALWKYSIQPQTTDDWHWLIVCDEAEGYKFPKDKRITVLKREPAEDGNRPSICANWLAALDWIDQHNEYDSFAVMEDDDWYHENYLRETRELLKKAELVGWQEDAYYYVLSRKARRVHNVGWASLATTAFRRSVLPYMRQCCEQDNVFIDLLLWKGIRQTVKMPQAPMSLPDGRTMTPRRLR